MIDCGVTQDTVISVELTTVVVTSIGAVSFGLIMKHTIESLSTHLKGQGRFGVDFWKLMAHKQ